jgi:hypothetical protein
MVVLALPNRLAEPAATLPCRPVFPPLVGRALKRFPPILLILALALGLRLVCLDSPTFGFHSWRQSDTAAVCRNFDPGGWRLLWPQIDWGGAGPGYVETECPIYCWAVAGVYAVFGEHVALARLVSIAGALAAIWFLYRTVDLCWGRRAALWGALIYAMLPLNVFYTRAIMPEPWMLGASAAGIYYFARWSRDGRALDLALSCIGICLACLIKLPSLCLGLPLLYLAWARLGPRALMTPALWIYAIGVMAPVALWYWHARQIYLDSHLTFGIFDTDKWGQMTPLLSRSFYANVFGGKVIAGHLRYVGFPLVLIGAALPCTRPGERMFHFWALAGLIFIFLVPIGNAVHEYYQLPLILPLAALMGRAVAAGWERHRPWMVAAVVALVFLSGVRYRYYLRDQDPARSPHYALGLAVQQVSRPGELILTVDPSLPGDPTTLYHSRRKGWSLWPEKLPDPVLAQISTEGAKLAVGVTENFRDDPSGQWLEHLLATHAVIARTDAYFIVRLEPPAPASQTPPP